MFKQLAQTRVLLGAGDQQMVELEPRKLRDFEGYHFLLYLVGDRIEDVVERFDA
jgi:hypothetical protein